MRIITLLTVSLALTAAQACGAPTPQPVEPTTPAATPTATASEQPKEDDSPPKQTTSASYVAPAAQCRLLVGTMQSYLQSFPAVMGMGRSLPQSRIAALGYSGSMAARYKRLAEHAASIPLGDVALRGLQKRAVAHAKQSAADVDKQGLLGAIAAREEALLADLNAECAKWQIESEQDLERVTKACAGGEQEMCVMQGMAARDDEVVNTACEAGAGLGCLLVVTKRHRARPGDALKDAAKRDVAQVCDAGQADACSLLALSELAEASAMTPALSLRFFEICSRGSHLACDKAAAVAQPNAAQREWLSHACAWGNDPSCEALAKAAPPR